MAMALVCDDDPVVAGVVSHLLEEHGWESTCAITSAFDAIDLAERFHPDLVVLDVALLGMSGLEALPRIHAVSPTTRIIVLSSYDEALHLALDVGATAVFAKSDLVGLQAALFRLAPMDGEESPAEQREDDVEASPAEIELVLQSIIAAEHRGHA